MSEEENARHNFNTANCDVSRCQQSETQIYYDIYGHCTCLKCLKQLFYRRQYLQIIFLSNLINLIVVAFFQYVTMQS